MPEASKMTCNRPSWSQYFALLIGKAKYRDREEEKERNTSL
jgi:hypothetical protein